MIDDGGNIKFWRNGGIVDMPAFWQPLGKRFDGKNMGDVRGVRFEDINGDVSCVPRVSSTMLTWCRVATIGSGSAMSVLPQLSRILAAVGKVKKVMVSMWHGDKVSSMERPLDLHIWAWVPS